MSSGLKAVSCRAFVKKTRRELLKFIDGGGGDNSGGNNELSIRLMDRLAGG